MNCQRCQSFLDAYLDNELDPSEAIGIQGHIDVCDACRDLLCSRQDVQALVRSEELRCSAPKALRNQIEQIVMLPRARVGEQNRRRRSSRLSMALAAAFGIALGAIVTWLAIAGYLQADSNQRLVEELAANHKRSMLAPHLVDVRYPEEGGIAKWFTDRVGFAPPVKDLQAAGYTLIGGRLDYLDHREVVVLIYRSGQSVINLFTWPVQTSHLEQEQTFKRDGLNLVHWQEAGMAMWAVSDLPENLLRRFCDSLEE
jgi:anti-sigma factor RsiW